MIHRISFHRSSFLGGLFSFLAALVRLVMYLFGQKLLKVISMNRQITSIASKIRRVRSSKGLSPEQFKSLTGVSPRTLARLENLDSPENTYVPKIDTLQKVSSGLGYRLGEFLNARVRELT